MVAFASSLDQAGPIARTVRDCAIMLRSMAGHDPKDSTCVDAPVPDYEAAVGRSVKGLTIGIPKEYRLDGMNPEIEALWAQRRRMAAGGGREDRRRLAAATRATRCPPITSSRRRKPRRNLARYDGVRYGLREPADDIVDLYEKTRAQGLWRGSAPAPDDRHLCAVGRLLRRLLRARAENPHADQARLRDACSPTASTRS